MILRNSIVLFFLITCCSQGQAALPPLEEVLSSGRDLWGEAALKRPGGPTYEFFAGLLPPPRYVNADFRYYPIVLSAPRSISKARLISNGSALNAPGGARSWKDTGTRLVFRVGPDELRFGEYPARLRGPRYLQDWLPIVQIEYEHGESVYAQESFATVDPAYTQEGVVLVRFWLAAGTNGLLSVQVDAKGTLMAQGDHLVDSEGIIIWFDQNWQWNRQRQRLSARLSANSSATLAITTNPAVPSHSSPLGRASRPGEPSKGYEKQKQECTALWKDLIGSGMNVEVPEPIVNRAWRSVLAGTFALIHSNRMHYSAGNQYDRLYEAEGSDAVQALLLWGFADECRRLIPALLDYTRRGLEFHQAGHKLQLLTHYFWLTGDSVFIEQFRSQWEKELHRLRQGRLPGHGLFPREQYCGDVATPVFSLNSNAKGWRALRDWAAVLAQLDQDQESQKVAAVAAAFREDILRAVEKSERRDIDPPFTPIALFGEEEPYGTITASKMGSYWNLMINYVLGSGIFGIGSERESTILQYIQQRGGLCMGLTRSRPNPTFWTGSSNVNPLYGLRYVLTLLERDEPDRALVSFYGMLAQGMTRDTFIGGEGASLTPLDEQGRLFYCPPNSASNGFFLTMLRWLLLQDLDLDEDGQPETLRLLFATPRRWLQDGQVIQMQRAPTAFGELNLMVQSLLNKGEVISEIDLPRRRQPRRILFRCRLPSPWRISSATINDQVAERVDNETLDLSGSKGKLIVRLKVGAR